MRNCAQCKYSEKWDNGEYHCLKEIGTENSSLHSGNWFCADFKEKNLAEKIFWILIKEGQHNVSFPLGSIIKYTPEEVRDIMRKHGNELI